MNTGSQGNYQAQVWQFMLQCFGERVARDIVERNHRFLEEALELVQATGCTASEAHQLVEYVFGRAVGERAQEAGGVAVTFAALCTANGIDAADAANTELTRVFGMIERIRAKQAAKPKFGPLPQAPGPLRLDTDRQVFFYEQEFYVLSNFSAFRLTWKGWSFDTAEAAYHSEKFPGNDLLQFMIYDADSAHVAYKIAESHRAERRQDWDEPGEDGRPVKVGVMKAILHAKASQHEYVRRKLLETGNRELVENSWRDPYWGWGPDRNGANMLGKLWMEVRAELAAPGA